MCVLATEDVEYCITGLPVQIVLILQEYTQV